MTKALWLPFDRLDLLLDDLLRGVTPHSVQVKDCDFPVAKQTVKDNKLVLEFALAGYPKDSVSVEATDHSVTVKAEKVSKDSAYACRAFTKSYYDYNKEWDFRSASVEHKDGLLKVSVPELPLPKALVPTKLEVR